MDTVLELVLILIALAAIIGLPAIALMLPGADEREADGIEDHAARGGQASLGDEAAHLRSEVAELSARLRAGRSTDRSARVSGSTSTFSPRVASTTTGYGRPVARGVDSRRTCVADGGDRVFSGLAATAAEALD